MEFTPKMVETDCELNKLLYQKVVGTMEERKGVARVREVRYAGMVRGPVIIVNRIE